MNTQTSMPCSTYNPSWALPIVDETDCAACRPLKTSPTSSQTSLIVETPQCTDKCIVVACDQPDHQDLDEIFGACSSGQCEAVCDIAHEPLEWPCAEPNCQMKEMLRCCLNELPPSLSNQVCNDHHHLQNWPWEQCDGLQASTCQPQCTAAIIPDSKSVSTQFDEVSTIRCMWGECDRSFLNQMDLLAHVHSEHLHSFPEQHEGFHHQYTAQNQVGSYDMNNYYHDEATQKAFACLWDDCGLEVPAAHTGYYQEISNCDADSLLNHLLTNHFGLNGPSSGLQEHTNAPFTPDEVGTIMEFSSSSATASDQGTIVSCEWQDCTACFSSCDDLNNHIAEVHIGHGKSSYECLWKDCDRHGGNSFPSKQKVMRHMQKHSGFKPHVCTVCQEKFAETTSLQQHMRRHTQEKPYVCDFPGCGKAFSIPGGLRIHKRAHSGEKPFKCPEAGCGRAFSESSNLAKHMRIHSGLKPFVCTHPGCDRRFGRKDQLLRHATLHRTFAHQERDRVEGVAVAV